MRDPQLAKMLKSKCHRDRIIRKIKARGGTQVVNGINLRKYLMIRQ